MSPPYGTDSDFGPGMTTVFQPMDDIYETNIEYTYLQQLDPYGACSPPTYQVHDTSYMTPYYANNSLNSQATVDGGFYTSQMDITHALSFYESEDPEGSVEVPIQPEADSCSITTYPYTASEGNHKLPNFKDIFSRCGIQQKKPTTRRGRPPTYPKPGYPYFDTDGIDSDEGRLSPNGSSNGSTRCRKGAKNILLWKFLLEELRKPGATHVQWVTERDGVFKFVDTQECSRLWGLKKRKDDMNFEKLSRGIRHYYKDGLMSRVDGTRLVYQFHWNRVPRAFRCHGR